MATLPIQSQGLREEVGVVRDSLRLMGVAPRDFALPSALGVASTILRLLTLSLFLPLVHGLLKGDFSRLDRIVPMSRLLGERSDGEMFAILGTAVVVVAMMRAVCAYTADQIVARRVEAAQNQLSRVVLGRHLAFGQQFYDLKRTGAMVRLIHRLRNRSERVLSFINGAFNATASLSLYLVALAIISWPLTLGALVVLAGYVFVFGRLVDRVDDASERIDEAEDQLYASVHDLVVNLPLVKLAGRQDAEVADFGRLSEEASKVRLEEGRVGGIVEPLRDFFDIFVLLFFVGICAMVVRGLELEAIPKYLVFFLIFRRTMSNFSTIQKLPVNWKRLVFRLEVMFRALEDDEKFVIPDGEREFDGLHDGIEVRDLDFSYLKKGRVLEGVNLALPRGQRTFVVGSTGSGKSTLFRLLLRLYDCEPGAITVDGVDIREFRIASLLERVAFAGSDPLFFNDSIRHNVTYGIGPVSDERLRDAANRAEALDFIEALDEGFDEVIGDRGTRLSSGEKQRLALIRVFLSDPELILLDEGTSALDGATEASVLAALEVFAADRTLVVIAHRLSNLRPDDRVVVFEKGKVVEEGWRDELLAAGGALARLWDAQNLPAEHRGTSPAGATATPARLQPAHR
jgi:subfamily B ATP-binding cassette protein MsbA